MKDMHPIQLQILKQLLFATKIRYTELKPDKEMENNQFDFHLDKMIAAGYIEKTEEGYKLTTSGKEFANRMDTGTVRIKRQAKISAWVAATKEIDGGLAYLVYTRLKQPFYGSQGFPSGKAEYGEKIVEAAERELKEETGLSGKAEIVHIRHYRVFDKSTNELVEDKFMFLCIARDPSGDLISESSEGRYEWVKESELEAKVTNHFQSFEAMLGDVKLVKEFNGTVTVEEVDHWTEKF